MPPQAISLEPLLRLAGFRPDLSRFGALSHARPLHTIRLADSPLVAGLAAEFDDTCLLTVPEGESTAPANLKLAVHAGRKRFAGVHIGILSAQGQLNVLLGDDQTKLVICTDANVRTQVQLFGKGRLFIGDQTRMAPGRLIVAQADVVFGDDCQIGEEVLVDTSGPPIVKEMDSGDTINGERRTVLVDRHVWLGRRVVVLPDVRIGAGSFVEPGAVVASDLPVNCQAGGAPARVVREKVQWARDPKR